MHNNLTGDQAFHHANIVSCSLLRNSRSNKYSYSCFCSSKTYTAGSSCEYSVSYNHFSVHEFSTGWRIGWACAPGNIASAIRNIHIKITDSAPAPFQDAALTALRSPPTYFDTLKTVNTNYFNVFLIVGITD